MYRKLIVAALMGACAMTIVVRATHTATPTVVHTMGAAASDTLPTTATTTTPTTEGAPTTATTTPTTTPTMEVGSSTTTTMHHAVATTTSTTVPTTIGTAAVVVRPTTTTTVNSPYVGSPDVDRCGKPLGYSPTEVGAYYASAFAKDGTLKVAWQNKGTHLVNTPSVVVEVREVDAATGERTNTVLASIVLAPSQQDVCAGQVASWTSTAPAGSAAVVSVNGVAISNPIWS